jgi:arylsulfatase A-like enzyme
MERAKAFLKRSVEGGKPFFLYFNHSMVHLPTMTRAEFKAKTRHGDFFDSLFELDSDFGELLDHLAALGIANKTTAVFSEDNGTEESGPVSASWQDANSTTRSHLTFQ